MELNFCGVHVLGRDDMQHYPTIRGAGHQPIIGDGQNARLFEVQSKCGSGGTIAARPGIFDWPCRASFDRSGEVHTGGVAVSGDFRWVIQGRLDGKSGN
jgi:hypothetical protein